MSQTLGIYRDETLIRQDLNQLNPANRAAYTEAWRAAGGKGEPVLLAEDALFIGIKASVAKTYLAIKDDPAQAGYAEILREDMDYESHTQAIRRIAGERVRGNRKSLLPELSPAAQDAVDRSVERLNARRRRL